MDGKQIVDEMRRVAELIHTSNANTAEARAEQLRLNNRIDQLQDQLTTANRRPALAGMDGVGRSDAAPLNQDNRTFLRAVAAGGVEKLEDSGERSNAKRIAQAVADHKEYAGVSERERKALSLGDDTLGGFLAPPEYALQIIKGVQLISPIRGYAYVRQTVHRSVQVPVRSGVFAAQWIGETATRSETTGLAYSLEELSTFEMYAEVIVSNQDLEDSAFDLATDISDNASEQFAKAEGLAFVKGTSIKQPEGFMTNAAVAYVPGTDASLLKAQGIINLVYALKSAYAAKASLMMNRKTLGLVRSMTDLQGRFIWEPNYQQGTPQLLLGIPVVESPDMDDVGANAFPIAVGDFSRGYMIVDRVNIQVLRLQEKYAEQGQVAFLVRKRVGGQVVLPEAILKLKISTS